MNGEHKHIISVKRDDNDPVFLLVVGSINNWAVNELSTNDVRVLTLVDNYTGIPYTRYVKREGRIEWHSYQHKTGKWLVVRELKTFTGHLEDPQRRPAREPKVPMSQDESRDELLTFLLLLRRRRHSGDFWAGCATLVLTCGWDAVFRDYPDLTPEEYSRISRIVAVDMQKREWKEQLMEYVKEAKRLDRLYGEERSAFAMNKAIENDDRMEAIFKDVELAYGNDEDAQRCIDQLIHDVYVKTCYKVVRYP